MVLREIPEREQHYFTEDEMRQIVNSVTGQWHALFATMTGTGLCCSEVFGLHVEDLDLPSNRISVRRSIWRGKKSRSKKSGNRTVNIEPALAEILREHLNGRATGRVFQNNNGTPFSKDNVRRKLLSVLDKTRFETSGAPCLSTSWLVPNHEQN